MAADLQQRLQAAGGRCQCEGECGHTHGWNATVKPSRCRVPHGCMIQRKRDYPSCWRLAGTEQIPLEYAELYFDRIESVELTLVGEKVLCGFCRRPPRPR